MVDADLVGRKLAVARSRLRDCEKLLARAEEAPAIAERDLGAFYLFLAIQEGIDLAAHWVSDEGWAPPAEAGTAFDVLADHGAIDEELAAAMRGAVGLRNRIAHGYTAIDHERLRREMGRGIDDLRRFLAAVATAAGL